MRRRDYVLMTAIIALSGMVGGAVTSWLISGQAVAQARIEDGKTIRAETIQLVDSNGIVRIELSAKTITNPGKDQVSLYGQDGKQMEIPKDKRIRVSGRSFGQKPGITIKDKWRRTIGPPLKKWKRCS